MTVRFEGEAISWRGPAPYVFIAVPEETSDTIKMISSELSYGWGCIPVKARINATEWSTSLFPKNGHYLVPIKMLVQRGERIEIGGEYAVTLEFGPQKR